MVTQILTYGDERIPYLICPIQELKGQVAIHVHPDGSVQVDAPPEATKEEVRTAVLKRARWVVQNVESFRKQREHVLPREYVGGESHFYLGRRYPLKIVTADEERRGVKLVRGRIQITAPNTEGDAVKALLRTWYRTRAKLYFRKIFGEILEGLPWVETMPKWRLQAMSKQWGSCSPKGTITLNPHLVKAPPQCVHYVLVHELCHLREHNHSKAFYRLLTDELPEWKSLKARLDGMAELLLNE